MKVKKVMGILLATALTASALFGCGTKDTKTSDNGDKVVVSISFWEGSTKKALQNSLKEISDKYTELHPNVVFDFQPQPNSGYQDWIKARMAADDAPVIEGNNTSVLKDQYKNGSLYSFSEEFNKPNPYVEGNKAWKDMFVDGKLDAAHEYETEPTYAVPTSGMGIGIYYNKDIYKELGLEIPETWDKFIENCKKINDSGKNPVAMMLMKPDAVGWFNWYLATGMFSNYYLANDKLNFNGDNIISTPELSKAVHEGTFDLTKGEDNKFVNKILDYSEEFGKYCQGAAGLDEAGAKAQFLAGTAGHIMSGSWDMDTFLNNQSVNIGVFSLPKFTKENSEYASSNMMISTVSTFGIIKSDKHTQAQYDAAIDFLKFFTAPENYKIYIEKSMASPVIKGLDVDPIFEVFNAGKNEVLHLIRSTTTSEVTESIALSTAMSGKPYNRDELIAGMQKALVEYCDESDRKAGNSAANNYGVDDSPKREAFVPTEP